MDTGKFADGVLRADSCNQREREKEVYHADKAGGTIEVHKEQMFLNRLYQYFEDTGKKATPDVAEKLLEMVDLDPAEQEEIYSELVNG
jgi:hypothetical protein